RTCAKQCAYLVVSRRSRASGTLIAWSSAQHAHSSARDRRSASEVVMLSRPSERGTSVARKRRMRHLCFSCFVLSLSFSGLFGCGADPDATTSSGSQATGAGGSGAGVTTGVGATGSGVGTGGSTGVGGSGGTGESVSAGAGGSLGTPPGTYVFLGGDT